MRSKISAAVQTQNPISACSRQFPKGKGKGNCIAVMEVMEHHVTATECHLPYGITQCYLLPDTSERTPSSPQPVTPVLGLPTPDGQKATLNQMTCYIPRWFTRPQAVTHPSPNSLFGSIEHSQPFLVTTRSLSVVWQTTICSADEKFSWLRYRSKNIHLYSSEILIASIQRQDIQTKQNKNSIKTM